MTVRELRRALSRVVDDVLLDMEVGIWDGEGWTASPLAGAAVQGLPLVADEELRRFGVLLVLKREA